MDYQKKHRAYGWPLRQWLENMPNELDRDAIGLWQIIPVGRHEFELTGEDLKTFTRVSLEKIFRRGGIPVTGNMGKWVRDHRYGVSESEIIENIIEVWSVDSFAEPDVEDGWFALPELIED
ncbi:hypothetical protein [Mesorhizobium sp. P5_C1]